MKIGLTSPDNDFTRDALGRYVLNTFDEMLVTIDPNARNTAGLPPRGDLRQFDFIIIGGGTFGAAVAEQLWFRSSSRSERILVLEGGPFLLPEHVQNLPALGLNAGGPRMDHQPQAEVWGLAWNSGIPFPGLAYCIGGRSVYWGGWSPRLLDSELPDSVWPHAVLDDLMPKTLPDGRKGYFRQSSDQIGATETNDFIFGKLHHAMRKRLFEALSANEISDAMPLTGLPDHPAIAYRDTPAAVADFAALLGIDVPSPTPSEQELRDLLKLEAPLAVQGQSGHAGFFPFNKFSTVPLLIKAAREAQTESGVDDVKKRVMIVPRCHVIRLNTVDDGGRRRVSEVITERGTIPVSQGAKVIIALGTIESTRLALLSFGSDGRIGTNLMAHLRSNVDIRVPRAAFGSLPAMAKALEASALLAKGEHQFKKPDGTPDGSAHFHFQITASGLGPGGNNSEAELFKKIPDIDTFDAHKHATDTHVVITIRGIGEMQPNNSASNVTLDLNPQQDDEFQTRRAFVNLQASTRDLVLWDAMDKASDDVAHAFAGGLEFEVFTPQGIKKARPAGGGQPRTDLKTILFYSPNNDPNPANRGRRDGLGTTHHEAGTLRMGNNANTSVTDANCRFHDVTNTYVAGPALFPTIGSPNPMLTGIALARRLADHLMPDPPPANPDPGFDYLFDGTEAQFANWVMAGGGSFSRSGRSMIARQNDRGIGLLYYRLEQFENFVLRFDFLLPHPRGANNDNSGVFVRFRDPRLPDPAPSPVDPADNAAFVAVHTGFEVQIDEEARGDTRFNEPDGSFFASTGAIYKITSLGTGAGQQDYKNTGSLAARQWHRCEIEVNGDDYIVRLNGQESTRFRRGVSDTVRGKPPSVDPHSGFIGVQTHTGNVAFANVRIKSI